MKKGVLKNVSRTLKNILSWAFHILDCLDQILVLIATPEQRYLPWGFVCPVAETLAYFGACNVCARHNVA